MNTRGERSEQLAEELQRIYDRDGVLDPEAIVEEIEKDPDHPLRDRFEWDDREAAHRYRVEQCRGLIRSVKIVVTTHTPAGPVEMRVGRWQPQAPGSIDPERASARGYVPISSVDPVSMAYLKGEISEALLALARKSIAVCGEARFWALLDEVVREQRQGK